jgi:hypothetical protein
MDCWLNQNRVQKRTEDDQGDTLGMDSAWLSLMTLEILGTTPGLICPEVCVARKRDPRGIYG